MDKNKFGLRYERLVIFSAPLTLLALLVLFIAAGRSLDRDQAALACYKQGSDILANHQVELEARWEGRPKDLKDPSAAYWKIYYRHDFKLFFIKHGTVATDCFDMLSQLVETKYALASPAAAQKDLANQADLTREAIQNRPIQAYGIEVPDKATILIFGTAIKFSIATLGQIVALALTPLIMGWLASLYHTRFRETLQISEAKTITEVYPHVMNIYAIGFPLPFRRRSRFFYYLRRLEPLIPTIFRLVVLSVLILPPVSAYCTALFFLKSSTHWALLAGAGFMVCIFTLGNFAIEMLPWHSAMYFRDQRTRGR